MKKLGNICIFPAPLSFWAFQSNFCLSLPISVESPRCDNNTQVVPEQQQQKLKKKNYPKLEKNWKKDCLIATWS